MTPEQLAVAFNAEQSTTGSKVIHRLGWARTYLKKVELIDNPGRGEWALLDEGQRVLGFPATEAVDLRLTSWLDQASGLRHSLDMLAGGRSKAA